MLKHFSRRGFLAIAGSGLLGSTSLAMPVLNSKMPPWFNFKQELTNTWDFTVISPDHVKINAIGFHGNALTRVLVLYAQKSTAYDVAISEMLTIFDEKRLRLRLDVVYYGSQPDTAMAAVKAAETDGTKAIVAMGSDTTSLMLKNYRDGKLPVITVCSKDPVILKQTPSYEYGSGTNFAFTSLNMPIDAQVGYLLQLRPHLKNVAVLVDASNVSAVETQAKPVAEYLNRRDIRALSLAVTNGASAPAQLPGMMSHAIAAMRRTDPTLQNSVFWITGSTAIFNQLKIISSMADKVPVISVVPEVVRPGDDSAVLSVGVSFESNAHLAAIYVSKVLKDPTSVGKLKVGVVSPPDIAINFRKAKAIDLRIPFSFFESATTVYDYDGKLVRADGVNINRQLISTRVPAGAKNAIINQ
ncbi:MAG: hypothetical protein KGQ37_02615 [Hyphomicrobiales bacterium]|nr:hypothetical protein [Hyphomicrobiales bacterium]